MGRTAKRGTIVLAALVVATATLATSSSASGGGGDPDGYSAETLTADSMESAAKSVTGRLAQTDPSLLGRTRRDAGERRRQARLRRHRELRRRHRRPPCDQPERHRRRRSRATRPPSRSTRTTRRTSTRRSAPSWRRRSRRPRPAAASSASTAASPSSCRPTRSASCWRLPDVAAVQSDELQQPQTDSSTAFIGAPTIWDQSAGRRSPARA